MPMIEFDFLPDVLKESIVLTLTVTVLMFIIEAVNISSKGRMFSFLHRKTYCLLYTSPSPRDS